VVILEAILDNERQDLLEFFHGSAQLKVHSCRMLVDIRSAVSL
jgi:hypothetical protein